MVRKERIGVVVSNKPEKTIVVAIQTRYRHPKYGKILIKLSALVCFGAGSGAGGGLFIMIAPCSGIFSPSSGSNNVKSF